jgi:hypothetical protein
LLRRSVTSGLGRRFDGGRGGLACRGRSCLIPTPIFRYKFLQKMKQKITAVCRYCFVPIGIRYSFLFPVSFEKMVLSTIGYRFLVATVLTGLLRFLRRSSATSLYKNEPKKITAVCGYRFVPIDTVFYFR